MTDRTLTAMYDTSGAAESARDQLVGIGVAPEAISIHGAAGEAAAVDAEPQGFWASLVDLFMPDEDRHAYSEGLRRGGYLLSAQVPDHLEATAADLLESSEPIDLDHRREGWRQEGWADHPAAAPAIAAYGEGSGLAEVGDAVDAGAAPGEPGALADQADRARGIRVRSYAAERPVEDEGGARKPTSSGTVPLGHSVFASPGPRIATPSSDATHSRPPSSAATALMLSAAKSLLSRDSYTRELPPAGHTIALSPSRAARAPPLATARRPYDAMLRPPSGTCVTTPALVACSSAVEASAYTESSGASATDSKNSIDDAPALLTSTSRHAPFSRRCSLCVDATHTRPALSTAIPASRSSPAPIFAFSSVVHALFT